MTYDLYGYKSLILGLYLGINQVVEELHLDLAFIAKSLFIKHLNESEVRDFLSIFFECCEMSVCEAFFYLVQMCIVPL